MVLENLKGIGRRVAVRKKQRAMFSGWSFYQLQQFIRYKAESQGVAVVFIDPHYTSQCCSKCFHIERGNRRFQSEFCCRRCGYAEHADPGAAKVIRILGLRQGSYGVEVALMRLQLQVTAFEAVVS
jgi:transposase